MHLKKIMILLISTTVFFPSYTVLAQEKITLMEIINQSPKCYALTEIINLYSKGGNDNYGNFYVNFSNATKLQSYPKDATVAVPLLFNDFARKFRNEIIKVIIESGYDQKSLGDIYDKIGCSIFSEKINFDKVILGSE